LKLQITLIVNQSLLNISFLFLVRFQHSMVASWRVEDWGNVVVRIIILMILLFWWGALTPRVSARVTYARSARIASIAHSYQYFWLPSTIYLYFWYPLYEFLKHIVVFANAPALSCLLISSPLAHQNHRKMPSSVSKSEWPPYYVGWHCLMQFCWHDADGDLLYRAGAVLGGYFAAFNVWNMRKLDFEGSFRINALPGEYSWMKRTRGYKRMRSGLPLDSLLITSALRTTTKLTSSTLRCSPGLCTT
jgi:hypothetical protein